MSIVSKYINKYNISLYKSIIDDKIDLIDKNKQRFLSFKVKAALLLGKKWILIYPTIMIENTYIDMQTTGSSTGFQVFAGRKLYCDFVLKSMYTNLVNTTDFYLLKLFDNSFLEIAIRDIECRGSYTNQYVITEVRSEIGSYGVNGCLKKM